MYSQGQPNEAVTLELIPEKEDLVLPRSALGTETAKSLRQEYFWKLNPTVIYIEREAVYMMAFM